MSKFDLETVDLAEVFDAVAKLVDEKAESVSDLFGQAFCAQFRNRVAEMFDACRAVEQSDWTRSDGERIDRAQWLTICEAAMLRGAYRGLAAAENTSYSSSIGRLRVLAKARADFEMAEVIGQVRDFGLVLTSVSIPTRP